MFQRILRWRLCWIWQPVAIALFVTCSSAWAQTTQTTQPEKRPQGSEYDYEVLLEQVAKRPLIKAELKRHDDKALSEAEQKEIAKSEKLMTDAKASRAKGDFAATQKQSREAQEIRGRILGPKHHLTVSSRVLADSMGLWSAVSEEEGRKKLIESDKQLQQVDELRDKGEYNAAAEAAQTAAALRAEVVPDDAAEISAALLLLGSVQIDLGQLDRSDETLTKAGGLIAVTYGDRHPQTARLLDRIGWLRISQARRDRTDSQKVDDAMKALRGAVRIFVGTLGESAEAAESLDNLGTAMVGYKEYKKALGVKMRALYIRQQVLGSDARDTGVSLANLAWLYERIGKEDQAMALRQQALAVFEKALGKDHPYAMIQKDSLARTYEKQGKQEEAVHMLEAMVAADGKRVDKLAPGMGARLVRLANAYLKIGRLDDGIRILMRASRHAKALADDDQRQPATQSLTAAADTCGRHRLFELELEFQQQVVDWDGARHGEKDSLIKIRRVSRLGGILIEVGRLNDAERILRQVVERLEKLRGKENVFLAAPLLILARVREKLGDLDEAEKLCDKVLQVSESKLRRKVPGIAYANMELGRISVLQGRLEMARFSLDEAREIFKQYAMQDPNGNIKILRELAHYHLKKGEPQEALILLREALQLCRDWSKRIITVHNRSATAKTLKTLLDATDANEPTLKNEREGWQTEFKTLLEAARASHALSAEEKAWLKQIEAQ